ncbi:MAG: YiiX/YebB-like N1pC/P60 family cysteine hydrolase [Isosphaeraceae bacterium]|nr:YiiX/YebB-like N1pC/P60 family cysteine hydrolase [Isosphaeraceae bacterium]
MWTLIWLTTTVFGRDGLEPTDRLVPPGWQGNPWGPVATRARENGQIPPITMSPTMKQWDAWGKNVLRDGDIVFRRADARVLFGRFPFSRFIANVTNSRFSHTGIVAVEKGEPVVYDTTKAGVRRQPFAVWMLDNVGAFGVKRVQPALHDRAQKAVEWCRDRYQRQVPFDYDLNLNDNALYCVEMTEKAYRAAGLKLSDPVRLAEMERVAEYPVCIFVFMQLSPLKLDQQVFFPGNERHGIWSCPSLQTVYVSPPPAPTASRRPAARPTSPTSDRRSPATPSQATAIRGAARPS